MFPMFTGLKMVLIIRDSLRISNINQIKAI